MRKKQNLILIVCAFLLILVPFFWNHGFFRVGGDDGKLYYQFPFEQISSYRNSIISDNSAGSLGSYFPIQFAIPFLTFIGMVKWAFYFLDTQSLLFGLNLAGGFLFFYLSLGLFITDDDWDSFFIKIFSGLFYLFSTFSFFTVWSLQLFSVYLVSVFPLLFYLFIKAVLKKNYIYLVTAAIVSFLFSVVLWTTPWLMALIISTSPLVFYVFLKNKKVFAKAVVIFLSLAVLVNFYWLVHFVYAPFSSDNSGDAISSVTSSQFREDNNGIIMDVSRHNQLMYPMFNLFHKQLQETSHWANYGIYRDWNLKFFSLNLIFLLIVFLGAFYASKSNRDRRGLFIASLAAWVIGLFFFTAHVSSWGTSVFLWLNTNIPGFSMFRNMHDKFGLALAFSYAFLLAISLKIFFENLDKILIKKIVLVSIFLITILGAKPFIFGDYYESPIWTTKNTHNTIKDFNADFYDLLDYLKNNHEASRYLWLPMNRAGYTLIQDKNLDNHYYAGTSPLQFLANTSDFAGFMSFGKFNVYLQNLILDRDYASVGKFMQGMNVKYIIVNNDISPDLQQSYFYKSVLYNAQQKDLFDVVLGDKVRDFGKRYSLYRINDQFDNEKIYLTNTIEKVPHDFSQVSYEKISSSAYQIKISNLAEKEKLVFLDPYHKLWELHFTPDDRTFVSGSHDLVFDYANGWTIDPQDIRKNFPKSDYKENPDGSIDLELTLYFKPAKYFNYGVVVSGLTLLCCIAYLGYAWKKQRGRALANKAK